MSLQTESIIDFLDPINIAMISNDEGFKDSQLGKHIAVFEEEFPDISQADFVIVGCGEMRGAGVGLTSTNAPDAIRAEYYKLFHWHTQVNVADIGNVKSGATLEDTYAALRTVVAELMDQKKKVVILGGSHDITPAQYQAYGTKERIIDVACVDARIDLDMDSVITYKEKVNKKNFESKTIRNGSVCKHCTIFCNNIFCFFVLVFYLLRLHDFYLEKTLNQKPFRFFWL